MFKETDGKNWVKKKQLGVEKDQRLHEIKERKVREKNAQDKEEHRQKSEVWKRQKRKQDKESREKNWGLEKMRKGVR